MLILQQSRNTALSIKRQAAQSHAKPTDTPKTHYWTLHCTPERRDPPLPTRRPTQSALTRDLDKPLVQPHPQGGTSTIKRNHKLPAYGKATQIQKSKQDEKAEKYSAGKGT